MKIFAFLLIFGAVSAAPALPLLRLGDTQLAKAKAGFLVSDRRATRGPLEITDDEAFLMLIVAEAFEPLTAAEVERRLAREGVRLEHVVTSAYRLNQRAAQTLRRHILRVANGKLDMDRRPRVVPGQAFRPVEDGVIWRGEWIDLTANQARFVATVADRGEASYAQLREEGWPSRRARELVGRVNQHLREDAFAIEYGKGIRFCAQGLQGR